MFGFERRSHVRVPSYGHDETRYGTLASPLPNIVPRFLSSILSRTVALILRRSGRVVLSLTHFSTVDICKPTTPQATRCQQPRPEPLFRTVVDRLPSQPRVVLRYLPSLASRSPSLACTDSTSPHGRQKTTAGDVPHPLPGCWGILPGLCTYRDKLCSIR